ncbi:MAG: hypothetical protein ABI700_21345 [Chloroflexota bacterium]
MTTRNVLFDSGEHIAQFHTISHHLDETVELLAARLAVNPAVGVDFKNTVNQLL